MKEKLNILFLSPGFYQVGDYFRYMGFADGLVDLGHKVTVITTSTEKRYIKSRVIVNGVELIYIPYWAGLKLAGKLSPYLSETKLPIDILYRVIFALLNSSQYDIVHGFHIGFNVYLPFIVTKMVSKRSRVVYDWCDLWDDGIISPPTSGTLRRLDYHFTVALERLSYKYADGITVNTNFLANRAIELGAKPENIALVREGAYTNLIKPMDKHMARSVLKIDDNVFLLGFAGFFNPDAKLLVHTLVKLKSYKNHCIKLLFIGPINPMFDSLIEQYSIRDMIMPVGPVVHKDLGIYLNACDVLLLPFSDDNLNLARYPMKLNDYLAVGKPVIAGSYGEVRDFFIKYPQIGIHCPGNSDDFAAAVLKFAGDHERIEQCSIDARNVAMTALDWTHAAQKMEAFYYNLLKRKRG